MLEAPDSSNRDGLGSYPQEATGFQASTKGSGARGTGQVAEYDFRQPSGLERHHQRSMHLLLEVFLHRVGGSLTANLGVPVHASIESLEQVTWDEYAASLPEPTCIGSFTLPPLSGRITLHLPLKLAVSFVEIRLGGSKGVVPFEISRPLSDIEQKVLAPVLKAIPEELPAVFAPLVSTRVAGLTQTSGARFLQATSASELCLVATCAISLGDTVRQQFSLCLQISTLRPLVDAMVLQEMERGQEVGEDACVTQERLLEIPVELALCFPEVALSPPEIALLEVGDVIPLHYEKDQPLAVTLSGREPILMALPASKGKRLAAVITASGT